jgi:anaerobic magnesium-protoporphyrin IX monomethyl ester cyclase
MGPALLSALLRDRGHEVELFDTTFMSLGYDGISQVRTRIKIFKPVDFSSHDVAKKKVDLDAEFTRKLEDFRPDAVAFSVLSDEVPIALQLSGMVKDWNERVPVLWGNKAATMAPERILGHRSVDYVCIGEGVQFMPEFIECLASNADPRGIANLAYRDETGSIRRNPLKPFYEELDALPYFDWSIFDPRQFLKPYDGKVYIGGDHMIYWGCANDCTYCINHAYRRLYGSGAGRFIRRYGVDRIVQELAYLVERWGVNFFKFHDEDFCLKPLSYFRELARKYEERVAVPFTAMANARNITEEKVKLLKQMHCASISIGIETGNERLRREVLKRRESKEDIVKAVRMLNDAGIRTSAFNMLGIPFETRETVMETIELNRLSRVQYPNSVFFYPLEGTELRAMAVSHGLFDEYDESVFDDVRPSLRLPGISAEELMALRERFSLYVKMPEAYYPYVERSERPDSLGQRLTEELYRIYEECVFVHDGAWNDNGKGGDYLRRLESICGLDCGTITP